MASSCQTFCTCMEVHIWNCILGTAKNTISLQCSSMKLISPEQNGKHWTERVKDAQRRPDMIQKNA